MADPVTGDDKLHWQGYSYSIDLSGGIRADYERDWDRRRQRSTDLV
ncbi:hypothetical protein [Streptomyces sp. NPDC127084]